MQYEIQIPTDIDFYNIWVEKTAELYFQSCKRNFEVKINSFSYGWICRTS